VLIVFYNVDHFIVVGCFDGDCCVFFALMPDAALVCEHFYFHSIVRMGVLPANFYFVIADNSGYSAIALAGPVLFVVAFLLKE